jgi:hypothetical protein
MPLAETIQQDMKAALRAGDRVRLGTLRLIRAALQQQEIDQRVTLSDELVLKVLDRMIKQRRESAAQYQQAGRQDLAEREEAEISVIRSYLPEPLSESQIDDLVQSTVNEVGAASMRDMGRVMGILKPRLQGRADLSSVSAKVKALLSS